MSRDGLAVRLFGTASVVHGLAHLRRGGTRSAVFGLRLRCLGRGEAATSVFEGLGSLRWEVLAVGFAFGGGVFGRV